MDGFVRTVAGLLPRTMTSWLPTNRQHSRFLHTSRPQIQRGCLKAEARNVLHKIQQGFRRVFFAKDVTWERRSVLGFTKASQVVALPMAVCAQMRPSLLHLELLLSLHNMRTSLKSSTTSPRTVIALLAHHLSKLPQDERRIPHSRP